MRHVTVATATLCILLVVPEMTKSDTTYTIQSYPSDQVDIFNPSITHTLSGTITTDGFIGVLTPSHILSWSVTFDGTDTFSSSQPNTTVAIQGSTLYASQGQITLATAPSGSIPTLILTTTQNPLTTSELQWIQETPYPASVRTSLNTKATTSGTLSSPRWVETNPG